MSPPTDIDYQSAIQNPRHVFSDPELQAGQPEMMNASLPLPKARTGNFAVAFRMNCGTTSWAVKCFTRGLHPDLRSRYAEISRYLDAKKPPYAVSFTFLPDGIRIDSQWFPVLKMEWINGESLTTYVERNLRNPAALVHLAAKWVELVRALRDAGIEHGDLQHGNVLIVNGSIRLIDYDGMFVPGLAGKRSHEKGHENYQHPLRDTEFGPGLDNFSAWVILISILAIAYEPQLWFQFKGGGDCLLFRRSDFVQPDRSRLLQTLISSHEPRVQSLASLFRNILFMPAQQVPSLNGQFASSGLPQQAPAAVHGWVSEHLSQNVGRERPAPGAMIAREASAPPDMSSWMLDFAETTPQARASFAESPSTDRLVAAISTVLGGLIAFGIAKGVLSTLLLTGLPGIVIANVAFWLIRYNREEVVRQRRAAMSRMADVDGELTRAEASVKVVEHEKWRSDVAGAAEAAEFREAQATIERRQLAELEVPRAEYRATAERITVHRGDIDRREFLLLRQIQDGSGAKLAQLQQQIAATAQGESAELAGALALLQKQAVANSLRAATLDRADIPGVGEGLRANMRACGIFTAAEADRVTYVKVKGIGDQKRSAILNWRYAVEARARARMPTSLGPAESQAIQSKYRNQRGTLEYERDRTRQQNASEVVAVQTQAQTDRRSCLTLESGAADKLRRAEGLIIARFDAERAKWATATTAAASATRKRGEECERRLQDARRSCFGVRWRRERVRHEVAAFDSVSFRGYVRRILPGVSS